MNEPPVRHLGRSPALSPPRWQTPSPFTPARFLFIGALSLGLTLCGPAWAVQFAVGMAPGALLHPSAETLRAACDAGVRMSFAGGNPDLPVGEAPTTLKVMSDATHTLTIQTPVGSALRMCMNTAMNLRAFPDETRLRASSMLWVKVTGSTSTAWWGEAQGWTATLDVVDSAGHLLTQLRPSLIRAGNPADWTADCQASRCVWTGHNQYGFDLGGIPADVLAALRSGDRMRVTLETTASVPDAPFSPVARVADHLN